MGIKLARVTGGASGMGKVYALPMAAAVNSQFKPQGHPKLRWKIIHLSNRE